MPNAVIAHEPYGKFDLDALKKEAKDWPGLVGMDLVPMVTSAQRFSWDETPWVWDKGYGRQTNPEFHVVAVDYGIKRNILRLLAGAGCKVTVVPAKTSAEDIMALKPDGVFLSNGPGDPAATGEYAVPVIKKLIDSGTPTFGICLGHQMLGIAVGGKTMKMHQGHHGANHPVKDLTTGKVEITSMNHGFAVDKDTLPKNVEQTHVSLFDGSNCGIALKDRPVFSVQYHPEASPGPRDSHYLFTRFVEMMRQAKTKSGRLPDDCLRRACPGISLRGIAHVSEIAGTSPLARTKRRIAIGTIERTRFLIVNAIAHPSPSFQGRRHGAEQSGVADAGLQGAVDLGKSSDPAAEIENLFADNGWGHGQWRNGIYPFVHYHSMIHEVLGIARGRRQSAARRPQGRDLRFCGRRCRGAAGRHRASAAVGQRRSSGDRRLSARGHI